MREPGYYLKLIMDLKIKEKDQYAIFNIISSKEIKIDVMNLTYNIGYISGHNYTEYERIIQMSWVNEWKSADDNSEIILEKLTKEEIQQIKIKKIIRNIEFELEELKEVMNEI